MSFNKIFAKLGSDYKKPDAITTMYDESLRPLFEADSEDFLLTLFNMNYSEKQEDVGQDVGQDVGRDVGQGKYVAQIIQMIRENNKITQEEMAKAFGVSEKTVERAMKKMTNVEYVGRGQNGHWEIKE